MGSGVHGVHTYVLQIFSLIKWPLNMKYELYISPSPSIVLVALLLALFSDCPLNLLKKEREKPGIDSHVILQRDVTVTIANVVTHSHSHMIG